ncbi:MAG: HAD family hydrolase [Victivallaceae bacterium]|nr:HAD family hydrolase [Victivallaceae bacterium]
MIKALLFDLNGTIIDILTDESRDEIYRTVANLLSFYGAATSADDFRELYWRLNKDMRRDSAEEFPEFDVLEIFQSIIDERAGDYTWSLPPEKRRLLPEILAETFRAASLLRLRLYPGAREVLNYLRANYTIAAVSDAQRLWAVAELDCVGLTGYFQPIVISSDFGFRKPDPRMYANALETLDVTPDEAIFIGNDMYRDVWGAHRAGMKTVFFKSGQGDQKSHGVDPDYIIYDFGQLPDAIRFLS